MKVCVSGTLDDPTVVVEGNEGDKAESVVATFLYTLAKLSGEEDD